MRKTILCVLGVASLTMASAQTKPGGISSEMLREIQKEQKAEQICKARSCNEYAQLQKEDQDDSDSLLGRRSVRER